MICIPKDMQPCQTCTFKSNSIEVACSTLTLPNNKQLHIFVLYRSSNVPLQSLLTTLSRMLVYTSASNMPTLILGDFNADIITQPSSSIITLMSSHGYTQLVQTPTTPNGTLIDHVYYNRPNSDIIVQVHDTYYSDHDAVYCSLPM